MWRWKARASTGSPCTIFSKTSLLSWWSMPTTSSMYPVARTDMKDAEWLCKLMTHGLLSPSFIPPQGQRELRELTRARSAMVRERTNLVNRLHKTLEAANIKLTSVVADVQGVSARAMLGALLHGQTDTAAIADLAHGRLRSKKADLERALEGRFKATQQFIVGELLTQIDGLDETLARFDQEIEKQCVPFEAAVAHLDTIPGVGKATAQQIVAEVGTDLSHFPTAGHLCAWAGVAPGNCQSGGKTLSSRTRQGNRSLKRALVEAAWSAARVKDTYLFALYHRLAGRRGKKRAIVAVAHALLKIAYVLIQRDEDYQGTRRQLLRHPPTGQNRAELTQSPEPTWLRRHAQPENSRTSSLNHNPQDTRE